MEDNNKKTLILSIIGILVLVIAVVGVSFAMYSFSGTGTKQNVITTGTVSMSFSQGSNNFTLPNKYPMSDAKGISQTDNKATFGVTATWGSSPLTIKYDIGITSISPGATLKENYIKVALLDGSDNVIVGIKNADNTLKAGVTIASLATVKGPNNLITSYGLTGGTISTSGATDSYTILAYVADNYELPIDKANTTTDNDGEATRDLTSKKTTASEEFSFKVSVKAAQA